MFTCGVCGRIFQRTRDGREKAMEHAFEHAQKGQSDNFKQQIDEVLREIGQISLN